MRLDTSVYEMKVHIVSSELYLKLVKECCVQLLLLELPMYPHRVSTNLQGKHWDGGAEVGLIWEEKNISYQSLRQCIQLM